MNRKFYLFLSGITLFRLIYAVFLPLAPQEAYYWNYSRHLALSYLDHPPFTAYVIKLTTFLGTSAFSIHLAAILLSIPLAIAVYHLARMLFDEWVGLWSAVAINLTFIYALGSLIITPDTPMLLFWVLSMIACHELSARDRKSWWILLGLFLGLGFASKYTIVFACLGALLFFLSSVRGRKWFTTPWPYLALLSALLAASPVINWNFAHDWASFAFQTSRRAGEISRFRPDFLFGFIGTIIGIYGIVPIPLLVAGIWNSLKTACKERTATQILIVSFSLPLVFFLLPLSLKYWVKMNWTAPAFIGWFIAAVAYYRRYERHRAWVRILGRASVAFLVVSFVAMHVLAVLPSFYLGKGDYYAGWSELAARVESVRAEMPKPCFIAGSEYKIPSQLAFHLKGHPETLGNNVIGLSGLQYDYWSDPDTLVGFNAIYIYDRSPDCESFRNTLLGFFADVSDPETFAIEKGGKIVRSYCIYRCYDYRGLK